MTYRRRCKYLFLGEYNFLGVLELRNLFWRGIQDPQLTGGRLCDDLHGKQRINWTYSKYCRKNKTLNITFLYPLGMLYGCQLKTVFYFR